MKTALPIKGRFTTSPCICTYMAVYRETGVVHFTAFSIHVMQGVVHLTLDLFVF